MTSKIDTPKSPKARRPYRAQKVVNGPELLLGIARVLGRDFPRERVLDFIVRVLMALEIRDVNSAAKPSTRKKYLKDQLKTVDAFLRNGRKPIPAYCVPIRVDEFVHGLNKMIFPSVSQQESEIVHSLQELSAFGRLHHEAMKAAGEYRGKIVEAIERTKQAKRSKEPAGSDGLIAQIAFDYQRTLGERPVTTEGGKFANVAIHVLKYVDGKIHKNVSRQLTAALEYLEANQAEFERTIAEFERERNQEAYTAAIDAFLQAANA